MTPTRAQLAQADAMSAALSLTESPPKCDSCQHLWHGTEGARACHHPSTSGPVGTPRVAVHKPPPDWCPLRKSAR